MQGLVRLAVTMRFYAALASSMKKPPAAALNGKNTKWSTRMTHGMTGWEASRLNTKPKRMYPHQCRICGKTYYNSRDSKKQGTCCERCRMIHEKIGYRMRGGTH